MKFKMNEYQLPEKISFNFEELKQELTDKVSLYETLVYTDDQIKTAKADKASLNKLKKALNDERIKREKEYMQPFNEFKAQVNEIIDIIDKPVLMIDRQVKEYEEKQKEEKKEAINEYWESKELPEGLNIDKIFDSKWLNATTSMKSIQTAIDDAIDKFKADMDTLSNLPEFGFEAQQEYISTLDIKKALDEAHRLSDIAKKKAEYEAQLAEAELAKGGVIKESISDVPEVGEVIVPQEKNSEILENFIPTFTEPEKEWVVVKVKASADDKAALEQYLRDSNIEYKFI